MRTIARIRKDGGERPNSDFSHYLNYLLDFGKFILYSIVCVNREKVGNIACFGRNFAKLNEFYSLKITYVVDCKRFI